MRPIGDRVSFSTRSELPRPGDDGRPPFTVVSVPLADKLAFLRRRDAYTPRPDEVVAIETHMAWVFLAGRHAFKLKKPVRTRSLDFGSVEARLRTCWEEVRLNRRLAPDVYLGVVPLALGPGGRLVLGGGGPVTDWLVHMRRLPFEGMLDREVTQGRVTEGKLRPAAELLAAFYRSLPPEPLQPGLYLDRIREEIRSTALELSEPSFRLPKREVAVAKRRLERFVEHRGGRLKRRAEGGRVVEGHGDLRPEHVHLGPPAAVIDCLEFDRELRVIDPVDDLSFLDLECRRLGSPVPGRVFLATYERVTADRPPPELLAFYRGFRAFVRAKIAIRHLEDDETADPERWRRRARRYLALVDLAMDSA